jgi:hypothetical protein
MRYLGNGIVAGVLAVGLEVAVSDELEVLPVGAAPFSEEELAGLVERQAADYFAAFQHPETGVLYGTRLASKSSFATPEEVLAEKPHPWGYGSRIADTVLHTGHLLVALLDAYEARPEPWIREQIAKHFSALKLIGSLPETHPKKGKPMLVGVVPRGPHPDAMGAWYDDSSMDQHTTYIIALARYATSELASAGEMAWIAESLGKVGRRLEGNGWRILRADGVTEAHVGFSWLGMNSNHASILLPAVMGLYAGTGDAHWKEVYEGFLSEREGKRWEVMHPGDHVRINGHPIYANQNAFRLSAYYRFEEDAERREVIGGLMEQSIELQLGRNFPGEIYRKFQPEERWARLAKDCGWEDAELRGAADAWGRFRPEMLEGKEAGMAALAHVRFPLGGYHMALMSEEEGTVQEVVPDVWKMLSTVELGKIAAGETHYLFTVVGLHLWAGVFGDEGSEGRRESGARGGCGH